MLAVRLSAHIACLLITVSIYRGVETQLYVTCVWSTSTETLVEITVVTAIPNSTSPGTRNDGVGRFEVG